MAQVLSGRPSSPCGISDWSLRLKDVGDFAFRQALPMANLGRLLLLLFSHLKNWEETIYPWCLSKAFR